MKCHYEVLGLERSADDAEIKSSYRKMALRWHPDKNLDDPEGAKVQFQLVQQAYEVLSDPQERSWYDKHREQILRGGNSNYEDNSLDVYQYFTATCYKGYGDDEAGFYAIYGQVFNQLAAEDVEFLETEGEFEAIPKFGNSQSDYDETVHRFYAFWQSFCTKKSYAWLSSHNINEIRDRRILKVVEKENKKIQQKARKERNEEIRSLVAFVRKRDRRVIAYRKLVEKRVAENRRKQAENDLEQAMKRKQEIEEQKRKQGDFFNAGYEEQLRQLEKSLRISDDEDEFHVNGDAVDLNIEVEELGEDLEGFSGEFYCVACNKTFKNHSSFRNHETSKKHKENVQRIKEEMIEEDKESLDEESIEISEENLNVENDIDEEPNKSEEEHDSDEQKPEKVPKKSKKQKKNNRKPVMKISSSESEEEDILNIKPNNGEDSDEDWSSKSKKVKSKPNKKEPKPQIPKEEDSKVKTKANPKKEVKPPNQDEESGAVEEDHICVTCKDHFPSKNKLFAHLKKTNHGVYIPKGSERTSATKKIKNPKK